MFQVTIPSRLVALSSVLVIVIVGSNLYLSEKLSQGSEVLAAGERLVTNLKTAIDASKSFGDLKYWLLELGVSKRPRTDENVLQAQNELAAKLDSLEEFDAETVAVLRLEVGALMDTTMIAIEVYNADDPSLGDSFLAKGLEHIWVVDRRLSGLVNNLEAEVAARRDAALTDARHAVDASRMTMVLSATLGIALTLLVVRSITVPLKRLMSAMSAITGGDLDADIPTPGRDEIGAMSRALSMLRTSLAERQRLMAAREHAELTKRQAQGLLSDAIETISEGFALYDAEDHLVQSNSRYRELLYGDTQLYASRGDSFASIIRRAARKGLIVDARDRVDEWVEERLARHQNPGEPHTLQRSGGRWIRVSERKTREGGTVAVYTDVTELKNHEEALRKSEERYALAMKGSNDGLWDWDLARDRVYVSPRFKEIAGLNKGIEFLTAPEFEPLVHPDDRQRHVDALRAHLRGESEFFSAEYRLVGENRRDHWVLIRGIGLRDEDGKVYRMAGSLADINTRKEAELALRDAKEQAEAATRTKSRFLANVSHEFRTPLNAVIGLSEMLREEAEESGEREFLEPLQRIVAASRHLLRLINDILDLSKIEAGRLDLHIEDFQVSTLVQEVITTADPLASNNDNELEIHCSEDLGIMHSDSTRVCQVLLNLLSNAFKFTEGGTVALDLERETTDGEDWLTVKVSDNGAGMSKQQMGQLFQEFMPTDSATTRRYGGAGLGLAISRRLCRLLGGDIGVESELGSGTTFTVKLPLITPEANTGHAA